MAEKDKYEYDFTKLSEENIKNFKGGENSEDTKKKEKWVSKK
jgi:hypothetical protein